MASAKFPGLGNRSSSPKNVNGTASNHVERRRRARSSVQWPVQLFRNAGDGTVVETITRNLSSCGFYCLSERAFEVGESLFCAMRIPLNGAEGPEGRLECRVIVVRVEEKLESDLYGIACATEDYHVGWNSHFIGSHD